MCSCYEKQLRVAVAAKRSCYDELVAGADTIAQAALHVEMYRGIAWRLFDADGYDAKLAEHVGILRARLQAAAAGVNGSALPLEPQTGKSAKRRQRQAKITDIRRAAATHTVCLHRGTTV